LRRWEELRPEFDARGVKIVTLCTDKPEAIKAGHRRHRLQGVMLSDRDLTVTDQFGIRNQGFHSGPPGLVGMPVPTSILADAEGVVRWIDQSENYQRRSDPEHVLGALREHLG
jgi:peroxiredoxin